MHPTGQGHDFSTPPSLDASWTVAQAPLERNSLVSSAAWTNTLIPAKLLLILVVVSFVYTVPGRRFLQFHHGTCLYCRHSIYCSQIQHIFRSMEYVERKKTTVVSRFRQKISAVIFRYAYKKRERKEEKEKCFLFFSFCFGHKKIVFFFRENPRVASSRSQRVSRIVVGVVLLLRVNVLMQKLNIREGCERKQD